MIKRPLKVKGETDDSSYGEANKAAKSTYGPEVIAVRSRWGTGLIQGRSSQGQTIECDLDKWGRVTSPHITRQRRGKNNKGCLTEQN